MDISVIICTLSRSESIRRLLQSIACQEKLPDQIIIVDASDDHETERIVMFTDSLSDRIEYYRTARGLTKQRNFGISKAKCKIVGFFDDDTVLDKDYILQIKNCFSLSSSSKVGGVTGYVYIVPKNSLKEKFLGLYDILTGMKMLSKCFDMPLMPEYKFDYLFPIRYVSGCNMFFRKEVFASIKFDTWFEGYGLGEDIDFGLRVSNRWKILACGSARLHHFHEPNGRPNYFKQGKMRFENLVKLLFIARKKNIIRNAFLLYFSQIFGVLLVSCYMVICLRIRDAVSYFTGSLIGFIISLSYMIRKMHGSKYTTN